MAYADQFKRYNPFTFQTPDSFAPWASCLMDDLRQDFKRIGWSAQDIQRAARAMDVCLVRHSKEILRNPTLKTQLLADRYCVGNRAAIAKASTVETLRAAATDLALYLAIPVTLNEIENCQPKDRREIQGFEMLASLSMWKMIDAIDVLATSKVNAVVLSTATRFAMESMAAGNLALALEYSIQSIDSEGRGMTMAAQQAESEIQEEIKVSQSMNGLLGAMTKAVKLNFDGNRNLVLQLAIESGHTKQYAAADKIAETLQKRGISIKESTVKTYLREAGWPRDYIKKEKVAARSK